jgi:hypothetical protein
MYDTVGFKFVLFSQNLFWPAALILIYKRLECFFVFKLNPGILAMARLSIHMNQCLGQTVFKIPDSTWFDGELYRERLIIRTFDWQGLEFVATPLDAEGLVFRGRPPDRQLACVVWLSRTKVTNGIDFIWDRWSRNRRAADGRGFGGLLWSPGPWDIC